jgi:predicted Zn finger-like uncharacterized protein
VVIRCERCSTLYELDEELLSPGGSQVQCTRCGHVFTAHPPSAAGPALAGLPPQPAAEPPAPEPKPSASPAGPGAAAVAAAAAPAVADAPPEPEPPPPPPPRPEPRTVRTGPPPVYRPSAASVPPTSGRAALLRRDTVGTFENRLRWSARWRWLAPALTAGVAAVAVAGWLLLDRRAAPEAPRARSEAMPLLLLDDAASLEQAIARLDAVLRRSPQQRVAASEHALAYVLRAASLADEGEALKGRLAARAMERERLAREQPAGWEESERAAAADAQKLEGDVRAREERARGLGGAALQALKRLGSEPGEGPEVARGLAAYYALGGERDRARKIIGAARERAPADPWLDLAEAWVDARDPDHAARERALIELGTLSVAHPELLHARYLLARTQAALGRRGEAIATLDALLVANGKHEGARRLRDAITAPAQAPAGLAASPPAPGTSPAPAPAATQPRKLVTHTVPAPPPVPSVTVLPPLGPTGEPEARPSRRSAPAAASSGPGEAQTSPAESAPPAVPAASGAPPGGPRSADAPPADGGSAREPQPPPPSGGG